MLRAIILAAGKGKRMGESELPKVLHPLKGKPLLAYVLEAVTDSAVDAKPVVIIGHMGEKVRQTFGNSCEYVVQKELKGTGDAVRCAREVLEGAAKHVLVLVGDQPLLRGATMRRLADMHLASGATLTMGTVSVDDFDAWRKPFADFGRVLRDADGRVSRIVEMKDATPEEQAVREINPSCYCFKAEWLWKALERLTTANAQHEYYLTDLLAAAVTAGERVMTVPLEPREAVGVNTPEQLALAEAALALHHNGAGLEAQTKTPA